MHANHSSKDKSPLASAIAAALACILSAAAGAAGVGNPAGDSPLTPDAAAAPKGSNTVDQLFVFLAGSGGHAEVEAGDLAADKAGDARVRAFGKRMVDDHKTANKKLMQGADSAGLKAAGAVADPDHEAQRKHLSSLKGSEFDKEYMRTQIADHQRTATLLAWEIGSGQNEGLKDYAAATLPTVLEHLEQARSTLDQVVAPQP